MSRKSTKLNPSRIIDHIDDDSLRVFVTKYAEKDADFLYKMWVKFATRVEFEDERDKYDYLFFKILHQYLSSSANPTKKRIKQLWRLYNDLAGHAADAISLEGYQEAFYIIRPGILYGKLALKRGMPKDEEGYLHDLYLLYHRLLGQLINQMLPPPLIDRIAGFCIEESLVYDYHLADPGFNLFSLGFRLIYDKKTAKAYLTRIAEKFNEIQANSVSPYYIKEIAVREAYRWDSKEMWLKWFREGRLKQEEVAQLAQIFLAEGQDELAFEFTESLSSKLRSLHAKRTLEIQIEAWNENRSENGLSRAVEACLKFDPNINHLYKLLEDKQLKEGSRSKIYLKIERYMLMQSSNFHYYDWMLLRKEYEGLLSQIEKDNHARYLIDHFGRLPVKYHERALALLTDWLGDQLKMAYGKQGSNIVRDVVHELRRQELFAIADRVLGQVRSNFPQRKSIQAVS